MTYWKFICNWRTERECLIRKLVGNNNEFDEDSERLDVSEDDTIFLHRTRQAEDREGFLLGPFIAVSDAAEEIQPGAWSHLWGRGEKPCEKKSYFFWQVKIDWTETVYSLNLFDFYDSVDDPPVDITAHAQSFSEVEGGYLLGRVKKMGDPIISPP